MARINFEAALKERLPNACSRFETGNFDYLRFPMPLGPRLCRTISDALFQFLNALHVYQRLPDPDRVARAVESICKDNEEWQRAYDLLIDSYSRDLLLNLILFRILGYRHVKLPTNNATYWQKRRLVKQYCRSANGSSEAGVDTFVVPVNSATVKISCHALHVLNTFVLEQYACRRLNPNTVAEAGDVVIDGGGCWGDSALYFAVKTGEAGRTYSFEFNEANSSLFRSNLAANPNLAHRIQILNRALWSTSDERIASSGSGTSAHLDDYGSEQSVLTISIDDFVEQRKIERVDFIKLDIEGAEYAALLGAGETLRRFRPKLAISVYHALEDLYRVLLHVDSLKLGYAFALDHYTIHHEETVLFAVVPR